MRIIWEMDAGTLERQFRNDHRLLEPVEITSVEHDGYSECVLFEFEIDDDDAERIRDGLGGTLIMSAD